MQYEVTREDVKSYIGDGETVRARFLTTHASNITALHARSAPRTTPACPALCCHCPRRTANSSVACCARPVVWRLSAHSPLRAQALRISLRNIPHIAHRPQHTDSNVGTPQCPALWPWLLRLSLSIPFPEEPYIFRPTNTLLSVHDHPQHHLLPACLFSEPSIHPESAQTLESLCLDSTYSAYCNDPPLLKWRLQHPHSRSRRRQGYPLQR